MTLHVVYVAEDGGIIFLYEPITYCSVGTDGWPRLKMQVFHRRIPCRSGCFCSFGEISSQRTLLSLGWLAGLVYSTLSTSSSRGLTYQIELNPFCHLIVPSLVQNLTNATSTRSLRKKASLLITESGKECCDNNCDYLVSDK
jgi:hypothetical protein